MVNIDFDYCNNLLFNIPAYICLFNLFVEQTSDTPKCSCSLCIPITPSLHCLNKTTTQTAPLATNLHRLMYKIQIILNDFIITHKVIHHNSPEFPSFPTTHYQ